MRILSKLVKVILGLIILTFVTMLLLFIIYLTPFPKKDLINIDAPSRFTVTKTSAFETQGYNECAAYATAYVLRSFDINVDGKNIYEKMKYKFPYLGVVPSKGIIDTFKRYDIKATYYKGDIYTLKMQVSRDIPVILYVGENIKWEHFITIIGYDNSSSVLYVFDSLLSDDLNAEEPGNRTLTEEELLRIWDNGLPILNHTYIAVDE